MEDWKYGELIEAVYEAYEEFMGKENEQKNKALGRLADEFYNMGNTEDKIINMVIGEILLTHENIHEGYYNRIQAELGSYLPEDHKNQLTEQELSDLSTRIKKVLQGIKSMKVIS